NAGVSVRYPAGWHVARRPLTRLESEILAITSFPLRQTEPDPNCAPETARSQLPPDGAFIYMFEYDRYAGRRNLLARLPQRPKHFSLRSLKPYECFGTSYLLAFHDQGRAFQIHVTLGRRATAKTRARVVETLDSLEITRSSPPASRHAVLTSCPR